MSSSRDSNGGSFSVTHFLAGTCGGLAAKTVGHPFDTIKVQLQAQGAGAHLGGPMDSIRWTMKNHGFFGFYRGLSTPLVTGMFISSIVMGLYGNMRRHLFESNLNTLPPWLLSGMSGCFAGSIVSFVQTPIELVKVRLQAPSTTGKFSGPIECARDQIAKHGVRGLWRGYSATILRETSGLTAQFIVYELVNQSFMKKYEKDRDQISPFVFLLSGAASGCAYWITCFPFDTAKCRMQVQTGGGVPPSVWKTFRAAVSGKGGWRSLYSGLGVTLCGKALPANAVYLPTYEIVMRTLDRRKHAETLALS